MALPGPHQVRRPLLSDPIVAKDLVRHVEHLLAREDHRFPAAPGVPDGPGCVTPFILDRLAPMTGIGSVPDKSHLSTKTIPPKERLILALDVPSLDEGKRWVERLGDSVQFYKLGLQLLMTGQYFEMVDWLAAQGKKVFADIKFFDVPETVKLAVEQLAHRKVDFATVHGNDPMLEAAVSAKGSIKILAVTVLTSLDRGDLDDLGFQCDPAELVLSRAKRAIKLGCDGVISSGLEAPALRDGLGQNFLVVSPGIRPVENRPVDDQKRTVDVAGAFLGGADYIVVGRPVRKATDPKAKAEEIQATIAGLFAK